MNKYYGTERLILKTLSPNEAVDALAYYKANEDFLKPFEPTRESDFYTLSYQRGLLLQDQQDLNTGQGMRLWLYLKSDHGVNRPIGNIGFTNIVRGIFQSCFVGYKLDGAHLKCGYMAEALRKSIEVMFQEFSLHRIEANIMPHNKASVALVKKLGFQEEGLAKDYLYINGTWEDHLHMVLLNQKFDFKPGL